MKVASGEVAPPAAGASAMADMVRPTRSSDSTLQDAGATKASGNRIGVDELLHRIRCKGHLHIRDIDWMRECTASEDDQVAAIEQLYSRMLKREVGPDAEFVAAWNAAEESRNAEIRQNLRKQTSELLRRKAEGSAAPGGAS
ncbi:MAG: hypothetical protein JNM94_12345 [Phycisphaerae bacterium]|nr:hypothetical protein [Phycisphaerae bacterium]